MAKFFIGEQDAQWFTVDRPPFSGDVRLKIKGATQTVLDEVEINKKRNPLYRAHSKTINGKRETMPPDERAAYAEEFLKLVVEDWEGVEDQNGEPIECTDDNKPLTARSSVLAQFVMEKSNLLAQVRVEEEVKNSNA